MSYIIGAIREVDFVKDLGAVLLDGVHLHQVWRKLPVLLTDGEKINKEITAPSIITQDDS